MHREEHQHLFTGHFHDSPGRPVQNAAVLGFIEVKDDGHGGGDTHTHTHHTHTVLTAISTTVRVDRYRMPPFWMLLKLRMMEVVSGDN